MDIDNHNLSRTKRIASRPKAKRIYAEPLNDREVLFLSIQTLWRRDPGIFVLGLRNMEDFLDWNNSAIKLWEAPLDVTVKMSAAATLQKVSAETFMSPPVD